MFDDTREELERCILSAKNELKRIDKAEVYLGSAHMSNFHVEATVLNLVAAADDFQNVTGHDLVAIVNDGLEHWRKMQPGTTPVINPAEHMGDADDHEGKATWRERLDR